jgi:hypothetical protein
MTTAARPTFFPAMGGEGLGFFRMEGGTKQISVKDMPGHTRLKMRKMEAAKSREELMAELEDKERAAKAGKKKGEDSSSSSAPSLSLGGAVPTLQLGPGEAEKDADDIDAANVEVRASQHGQEEAPLACVAVAVACAVRCCDWWLTACTHALLPLLLASPVTTRLTTRTKRRS